MLAIRFTQFVALVMLLVFGLAALVLLTQAGAVSIVWQSRPIAREITAIEWTGLGDNVTIQPGLAVRQHANKHKDQVLDAWTIYAFLMEGRCVASAVFCGASDIEKLYLCVDPAGRIGGLIVFGEEILTGYQANQDYWAMKVGKPEWVICDD